MGNTLRDFSFISVGPQGAAYCVAVVLASHYQFWTEKRRRENRETGSLANTVAVCWMTERSWDLPYIFMSTLTIEYLEVMHMACCQTSKLKDYLMKLGIIAIVRC